jgi:hypothetical protein
MLHTTNTPARLTGSITCDVITANRRDHDAGRRESRPKRGRDGETAQMTRQKSLHLRNPCSMLWALCQSLLSAPGFLAGSTPRESSSSITWNVINAVAIKRFFEIAISSLEIGGLLTPRSRFLLIAWHGHTGSIQRRRLTVAELGSSSYRRDRYDVQFKSLRLDTPNS